MSVYPVTVDGSRDPVMRIFSLLIRAWQSLCDAKNYLVEAWQVILKECQAILKSSGLLNGLAWQL